MQHDASASAVTMNAAAASSSSSSSSSSRPAASSAYAHVMRGPLTLKGSSKPLGVVGGVPKKKTTKANSAVKTGSVQIAPQKPDLEDDSSETKHTNQLGKAKVNVPELQKVVDPRTPAEKRFQEIQAQRETERISKLAGESHRKKIEKFNEQLETLPSHFDIPKVGPG